MTMQPEWITQEKVATAIGESAGKKMLPALASLRFDRIHEGLCLQIMHIGSYEAEGPTLARLHEEVMPARGYTFNGPHHEIYLGDPRKGARQTPDHSPSARETGLRTPSLPSGTLDVPRHRPG